MGIAFYLALFELGWSLRSQGNLGIFFQLSGLEALVVLCNLASCKGDDLHLESKVIFGRASLSIFYRALSEIKKLSIMLEVEF